MFLLWLLLTFKIFPQEEVSFYSGMFYLSNYIASEEFLKLKETNSDLEQIDIIYEKAVSFFKGNISEALLCLTFTCLPFNKIDFETPFGILKIPLPSPPKVLFNKRLTNLPKNLFISSPKTDFGDKDKLSHFFGNAFLHYNISAFNFSKFMGIFVEKTEESFFANGGFDKRDIIANHLGELFAEMLKLNPAAKPSKALLTYQLLYLRDGL
ncbi:MAG: hypothetical protein FD143_1921 [Ignavibacteria bacterium]|nr:MAG: hypothetical protein FD143_1921 [Ignavibacteria bacterium]KAF0159924.1 MAG: hypothetical protein FD188_2049 [Ignavibacteria bacterium]